MGFNMFAEVRRAAEGTGARVWRRVEWRETTPGRRGLIASWTRAIAGGPVTRGALGGLATGGPGGAVVGAASAGVSTVQEQRAATARRRAAQAEVGEPAPGTNPAQGIPFAIMAVLGVFAVFRLLRRR